MRENEERATVAHYFEVIADAVVKFVLFELSFHGQVVSSHDTRGLACLRKSQANLILISDILAKEWYLEHI